MSVNRFYFAAMIALVSGLGYLTFQIIRPFLVPIGWAIVLSIVFYPLYIYILKYARWKSAAALIISLIVILIIIGPFSYFSYLLIDEAQNITSHIDSGQVETVKHLAGHPGIGYVINKIGAVFNMSLAKDELEKAIMDNASKLGKQAIGMIPVGLGNVAGALADFIFMTFSIFFIFRDGANFLQRARDYLPFPEEHKDRLAGQIRDIIVSTIYGGVVVAILQGIVGGIAYALLGIRSPVLWGFSTAIASFIPLLGTFTVWGSIAAYLFIMGMAWKGAILILVGVLGISMIDNVLKPVLIGARTKMPILVIFFSVLGGIKVFGLIGLIMGPLVVALFVSVVEIFRNLEGGQKA